MTHLVASVLSALNTSTLKENGYNKGRGFPVIPFNKYNRYSQPSKEGKDRVLFSIK